MELLTLILPTIELIDLRNIITLSPLEIITFPIIFVSIPILFCRTKIIILDDIVNINIVNMINIVNINLDDVWNFLPIILVLMKGTHIYIYTINDMNNKLLCYFSRWRPWNKKNENS